MLFEMVFPGEEVRAEFFMEELNNGVRLCQLIGVLQAKVNQNGPPERSKVSHVTLPFACTPASSNQLQTE